MLAHERQVGESRWPAAQVAVRHADPAQLVLLPRRPLALLVAYAPRSSAGGGGARGATATAKPKSWTPNPLTVRDLPTGPALGMRVAAPAVRAEPVEPRLHGILARVYLRISKSTGIRSLFLRWL